MPRSSDGTFGSPVNFWQPDGTLDVKGKVIECDPPRRLTITWRVEWIPELLSLAENLVSFQIDALGDLVRLTMTQSHREEIDDKLLDGGRKGWPIILSGLKTLLETGRPLPELDPAR